MVSWPRNTEEISDFLCSAVLFSEARVLFEMSKLPVLSAGKHEFGVDDIQPEEDTAFVMGSGSSINDVSDAEWKSVETSGDVFSFNYFFKGEFVPVDFHLAREIVPGCSVVQRHSSIKEYFLGIERNPMFSDTRFFVLHDHRATDTIWGTFFLGFLSNRDICLYQNDRHRDLPGEDLDSIAHNAATLFDVINLAYLMGYSEIVLMGVDLYDRRYFWSNGIDEDEGSKRTGNTADSIHETAHPVMAMMPRWESFLAERGVRLFVQNPKSLLNTQDVLPLYQL